MQAHVFNLLDADRLKGTQADMQGHGSDLHAALSDLVENLRGEMQAGGGCGDGASFARIDGLVALAVAGAVFAMDVGWKGHVAQPFDYREEIRNRAEAEGALAEVAMGDDFCLEISLAKLQAFAGKHFAAGPGQSFPFPCGELLDQEDLHASGG